MKKLIIDIIRPASFDAALIRLVAFAVIVSMFISCNSEKRVLRDPEKTARVVNKYLLTHPFDNDTVTQYITGDTVVQLLFSYDTAYIKGDALRDTLKITNNVYKTIKKTDTIIKSVVNNDLLKACQTQLMTAGYDKTQAVTAKDAAELQAKKWKLYFTVLAGAIVLLVVTYIYFGRK